MRSAGTSEAIAATTSTAAGGERERQRIADGDAPHEVAQRRGADARDDEADDDTCDRERDARQRCCDNGLARRCAKRDPDAELARAFRDRARHEAVEADGREQQRADRPARRAARVCARSRRDRFAAHVVECAELRERHQRIDRLDGALHLGGGGLLRVGHAHEPARREPRVHHFEERIRRLRRGNVGGAASMPTGP